jgi:hypothetical protein
MKDTKIENKRLLIDFQNQFIDLFDLPNTNLFSTFVKIY